MEILKLGVIVTLPIVVMLTVMTGALVGHLSDIKKELRKIRKQGKKND